MSKVDATLRFSVSNVLKLAAPPDHVVRKRRFMWSCACAHCSGSRITHGASTVSTGDKVSGDDLVNTCSGRFVAAFEEVGFVPEPPPPYGALTIGKWTSSHEVLSRVSLRFAWLCVVLCMGVQASIVP